MYDKQHVTDIALTVFWSPYSVSFNDRLLSVLVLFNRENQLIKAGFTVQPPRYRSKIYTP